MQRARSALARGDTTAALAELDNFARGPGWRRLAVEASLLRIEALARAGRRDEARNLAKRFVEQHPNNPLVDRARTFANPPAPRGSFEPISGEKP
jgi:outer membrane protein assembly factor BamD (BamD/ComL family)